MTTSDVIVIGGGIAGISAGAELAADMSVTVLEGERQIGYHSTGRSAAIFIRNYGNATLRALNALSAGLMERPEGVSDSSLLSPRGEMMVATEDEVATLEDYCAGAQGLERLSAAQAVELVPILRPELIAAAVIEWDAQDIDVDRMLNGYARLLRGRGGRIETGAQVTEIRREGGQWVVTAGAQDYRAPLIVNAAGAWAAQVADLAGVRTIPMHPLRRSAAILPARQMPQPVSHRAKPRLKIAPFPSAQIGKGTNAGFFQCRLGRGPYTPDQPNRFGLQKRLGLGLADHRIAAGFIQI